MGCVIVSLLQAIAAALMLRAAAVAGLTSPHPSATGVTALARRAAVHVPVHLNVPRIPSVSLFCPM
jgi:hypothetical protein